MAVNGQLKPPKPKIIDNSDTSKEDNSKNSSDEKKNIKSLSEKEKQEVKTKKRFKAQSKKRRRLFEGIHEYSKDSGFQQKGGTAGFDKGKEAQVSPKEAEKFKLDKITERSTTTLMHIKSVFPFKLFPDQLIIDENKLTVINGLFFWSDNIMPIFYRDINSIEVVTGLFFASIVIEVRGFHTNPNPLTFFWKDDAIKAPRLVTGLIAAERDGVDVTKLKNSELKEYADAIGRSRKKVAPNV